MQMDMSRIEEINAGDEQHATRDGQSLSVQNAQASVSRIDVPCSCPGCFSFEF